MRWSPRSLSVRLFLIMLGGVVLAVALTASLAERNRSKALRHFRLHAAITHLTDVIRLLTPLDPGSRVIAAARLEPREWTIDFGEIAGANGPKPVPELAWMLSNRLRGTVQVDAGWLEDPVGCEDAGPPPCPLAGKTAVVRVQFADGQRAQISYRRVRERPPPHEREGFLLNIAIFVASLALATWWAVRLALRPLRKMTLAAEAFGRDVSQPPMEESGPNEVRQAAQAFNAMQQRIRHNMAERTQILAAITHDLKTPLTRMQLRLEQCVDPMLRSKLAEDLSGMRLLVDEGLELARSMDATETAQAVDLGALLQSLCDDAAEAGQDVKYESGAGNPPVLVLGHPNALRRGFVNLIDNAVKYGQHARVELEARQTTAKVRIRDHGPGIAEEHLSEVMKPFVRLEHSRSRDTGGTGLGLAIADNLLRSQKGELNLRNLPGCGLEAIVTLPLRRAPLTKTAARVASSERR